MFYCYHFINKCCFISKNPFFFVALDLNVWCIRYDFFYQVGYSVKNHKNFEFFSSAEIKTIYLLYSGNKNAKSKFKFFANKNYTITYLNLNLNLNAFVECRVEGNDFFSLLSVFVLCKHECVQIPGPHMVNTC